MSTTEILKTEQRRPPTSPLPSQEPPEKKGHGWIWVLVILLLVGGAVGYSWKTRPDRTGAEKGGGGRGRGGPGGAGGGPVSVGTYPVLTQDVPFYLTGLGSVTPFYTVTVHSRVDGQMMKVYFQEGQFVHEGDALADIDPRPFQVALDQAQGQLAKDVASQADAKIDLGRYQQLFNEGVIPRAATRYATGDGGPVRWRDSSGQSADRQRKTATDVFAHRFADRWARSDLRLVDPGNIVHAADANGMIGDHPGAADRGGIHASGRQSASSGCGDEEPARWRWRLIAATTIRSWQKESCRRSTTRSTRPRDGEAEGGVCQ